MKIGRTAVYLKTYPFAKEGKEVCTKTEPVLGTNRGIGLGLRGGGMHEREGMHQLTDSEDGLLVGTERSTKRERGVRPSLRGGVAGKMAEPGGGTIECGC